MSQPDRSISRWCCTSSTRPPSQGYKLAQEAREIFTLQLDRTSRERNGFVKLSLMTNQFKSPLILTLLRSFLTNPSIRADKYQYDNSSFCRLQVRLTKPNSSPDFITRPPMV